MISVSGTKHMNHVARLAAAAPLTPGQYWAEPSNSEPAALQHCSPLQPHLVSLATTGNTASPSCTCLQPTSHTTQLITTLSACPLSSLCPDEPRVYTASSPLLLFHNLALHMPSKCYVGIIPARLNKTKYCGKLFIHTLLANVIFNIFIHKVVVIDNFCVLSGSGPFFAYWNWCFVICWKSTWKWQCRKNVTLLIG